MFELVPEAPQPLRFVRAAQNRLREARLTTPLGSVTRVSGLVIESLGPKASVGDICLIRDGSGRESQVEVVGFNEQRLILIPGRAFGPQGEGWIRLAYTSEALEDGIARLGRALHPA